MIFHEFLQGCPPWYQASSTKMKKRLAILKQSSQINAEINVTPLVDVVLVLLIIFMVVTPLLISEEMLLPQTQHHQNSQLKTDDIVLSLSCEKPFLGERTWKCQGNKLFLKNQEVSFAELPKKLTPLLEGKTPQIHLQADRRLSFEPVQEIIFTLQRLGLTNISLDSDPFSSSSSSDLSIEEPSNP